MKSATPDSDRDDEARALDRALRNLGRHDLDRLSARAIQVAAERRLAQAVRMPSRAERYEPSLLWVLAIAQLGWAVLRSIALHGS